MHANLKKTMTLLIVALSASLGAGCRPLGFALGGRDGWQKPDQVVQALAIRPGESVADLGAGSGYFTLRLAKAAGPAGRVFAVDVDAADLEDLGRRARELGFSNVQPVLAGPADSGLPEGGADLVFLCNTYHHLADRVGYFGGLKRSLRPGGRVAIVEMQNLPWYFGHGSDQTDSSTIRREMEAAGYRLIAEHGFLELQSFLVFAAAP